MTTADALAVGRGSYSQRSWRDAYARLSAADSETPLPLEDLERLATAAFLIGKDSESVGYLT